MADVSQKEKPDQRHLKSDQDSWNIMISGKKRKESTDISETEHMCQSRDSIIQQENMI